MPRKTWPTKADFDGAYKLRIARYREEYAGISADEPPGNYERRTLFNSSSSYPSGGATITQLDYVTPEWERILAHFGWPTSTSICIIGAGFGWAIEYLNSQGFTDVWGVDNSAYIQGAKDDIDPADGIKCSLVGYRLRDEDFAVDSDVQRFLLDSAHRNGPDGEEPFDVVVTERVLSSLEDSEAVSLSDRLRTMDVVKSTGQVIHIENSELPGPGLDPSMNWKLLAEWLVLLPADLFVRSGGGEFL